MELRKRALLFGGIVLGVVICVIAVRTLQTQLAQLSWADVTRSIAEMPRARLGTAALLVVASYAWLSNYDRIGLWASRKRSRRVVSTSFVAYAISKTLGFPAITSGLVRLRRYRESGFGVADLARFVVMAGTTLWLGLATLMGALLMVRPTTLLPLEPSWQRLLGAALVAVGVAWIALASRNIGEVRIKTWHFHMPTTRVAGAQLAVGAVDWILMSSVLWALLPTGAALHEVVVAVGLAQVVAVMAHVPGGAGVVEATLLALFKDRLDTAGVAAALVAFRVLYFLVPFAVAALFVGVEKAWHHARLARTRTMARAAAPS